MTAVDVDALDKLREAATAGPWQCETVEDRADVLAPGRFSRMLAFDIDRADAELIVAAVNALPEVLAEVRRGRALREAVEGLADEWARRGSVRDVGLSLTEAANRLLVEVLAAVDGEQ